MRTQAGVRPRTLEELGIPRKPFYTTAEVAGFLGVSDQHILDRIHMPADDPHHLYALALGPRTYRIPLGAVSKLLGIEPRITFTDRPRRIDEAVRSELATRKARVTRRAR